MHSHTYAHPHTKHMSTNYEFQSLLCDSLFLTKKKTEENQKGSWEDIAKDVPLVTFLQQAPASTFTSERKSVLL